MLRRFLRKGRRPPAISFSRNIVVDLDDMRCSFSSTPKNDDENKEQVSSHPYYSAHWKCQEDMLEACMDRLSKRIEMQDLYQTTVRTRQLANLGSSADTFQTLLQHLPKDVPLHMTVVEEQHPGRSQEDRLLPQTLDRNHSNHLSVSIMTESCDDESLFPSASMDFIMSSLFDHNCRRQWLMDTIQQMDKSSIDEEKQLNSGQRVNPPQEPWSRQVVRVNDEVATDPPSPLHHQQEASQLARQQQQQQQQQQLSAFLQHRARELRPGAELLLTMPGRPDPGCFENTESHHHMYDNGGYNCPLTVAIQRLVHEGTLRADVWERIMTASSYYSYWPLLTTKNDVKEAHKLALETDEGCLLELVDLRSYQQSRPISMSDGGGTHMDTTREGVYKQFWAVHGPSVASAGPHPEELESIQGALRQVIDEWYDPQTNFTATFVACVFRKRTRKRWNSTT